MSVTVQKRAKTPLATKPKGKPTEIMNLVDEIGALDAVITTATTKFADKWKAKSEDLKEKKEKLSGILSENVAPGDEIVKDGRKFRVKLGKAAISRTMKSIKIVRKLLGEKAFFKLAKVNLGDLDKYLTPPELKRAVITETTKNRKLTITKL